MGEEAQDNLVLRIQREAHVRARPFVQGSSVYAMRIHDAMNQELCNGKVKYSKNEAKNMKAKVGEQKNKSMRMYQCPLCFKYHLTKREGKY